MQVLGILVVPLAGDLHQPGVVVDQLLAAGSGGPSWALATANSKLGLGLGKPVQPAQQVGELGPEDDLVGELADVGLQVAGGGGQVTPLQAVGGR